MFLREQLQNKDDGIHSLLQQLAKLNNIFAESNHLRSHQTSDKMHCSLLSKHQEVQQNSTREELLLDKSIIVNETDNMNTATENRNLTAKTRNGNKHKKNRKQNSEQQKDEKSKRSIKKEIQVPY